MPAAILHDNGRRRLWVDRARLQPNLGPIYFRLLDRQVRRRALVGPPAGAAWDVDLVLCSTRATPQYTEEILDAWRIPHTVLGRHLATWSHVEKIHLVLEHIERNPEPEILLHLDATDVLVLGPLDDLAEAFRDQFGCELLFGAEKCSAPGATTAPGIRPEERRFIGRIEDFEAASYAPPFRHLNAGCFIGFKTAIAELFRWILEQRPSWPIHSTLPNGNVLADDDQLILRELHRLRHPRVQIDDRCRIFQNFFAIRRDEIDVGLEVPGLLPLIAAWAVHLGGLAGQRVRRMIGASSGGR